MSTTPTLEVTEILKKAREQKRPESKKTVIKKGLSVEDHQEIKPE